MMSNMPMTGSAGMDVFVNGSYAAAFRAELGENEVKGENPPLSGEKSEITVYLPLYPDASYRVFMNSICAHADYYDYHVKNES